MGQVGVFCGQVADDRLQALLVDVQPVGGVGLKALLVGRAKMRFGTGGQRGKTIAIRPEAA